MSKMTEIAVSVEDLSLQSAELLPDRKALGNVNFRQILTSQAVGGDCGNANGSGNDDAGDGGSAIAVVSAKATVVNLDHD
jgi:hypothetical protein